VRFRDVLAVREFRVLWIAHAQSRFGDQFSRVAIAVLVYDRTSSALLTALTYSLTFLPPLVTAPLLSGLADRHPRRSVLVLTDLYRATLVAVMAIPTLPMGAVAVLLLAIVSIQPLYSAARNAMLPNVLTGARYVVGLGMITVTDSFVQIAGFTFGGTLLGFISPHTALGINAMTFVLSASLVRLGTRLHQPTPDDGGQDRSPGDRRSIRRSVAMLWNDRRLRRLAALVWLYGFYIAPEGVAAPYAAQLGGGPVLVGLMMAADPVGAGIGMAVLSRWVRPANHPRIIGPLAMLSGVPLMLSALHPSALTVIPLWAISGFLSSYTMLAIAEFTLAVPDGRRGQTIGLVSAGLLTSQGLGILLAGALAGWLGPAASVAVCAGAGALCAIALAPRVAPSPAA
jgi:Major Facilitator Superfamily